MWWDQLQSSMNGGGGEGGTIIMEKQDTGEGKRKRKAAVGPPNTALLHSDTG